MLTGYIGSVTFLQQVIATLRALRGVPGTNADGPGGATAGTRDVQYFCDPVLGDNGQLYVPQVRRTDGRPTDRPTDRLTDCVAGSDCVR